MVEDNLGTTTMSPMSDLAPLAEGCGKEVTRTSFKLSRRTQDDDCKKDISNRDVNIEHLVRSTTWTNEKHNMYLNVLEASFVQQWHNSSSFVQRPLDLQLVDDHFDSSDQLAVLQKGSWRKMDLKKDLPLWCRTMGSQASEIESHWLHTPRRLNDRKTYHGRRRRRGFSHNLASSDSQCIEAEGTDQNFADEVVEKTTSKKIKRDSIDAETKMRVSNGVVDFQPETSNVFKVSEDPTQP